MLVGLMLVPPTRCTRPLAPSANFSETVFEHDTCPVSRASVASPAQDFRVLHDVTLQPLVITELHERRLGDDPNMTSTAQEVREYLEARYCGASVAHDGVAMRRGFRWVSGTTESSSAK